MALKLSPASRRARASRCWCVGIGLVSRITGAEILDRPASCGKPVVDVSVTIRDGDRICATGETRGRTA